MKMTMRWHILIFWALSSLSTDSGHQPGIAWLSSSGSKHCAGAVIASDIILTLAECLDQKIQVTWPYLAEVDHATLLPPDEKLALLFLKRDLPNPIPLYQYKTETLRNAYLRYATAEQTLIGSMADLNSISFTFSEPLTERLLLVGSPVIIQDTLLQEQIIGILIDSEKALRLDRYLASIEKAIHEARTHLPRAEHSLAKNTLALKPNNKTDPSQPSAIRHSPSTPISTGCAQIRRY